MSSERDTEGQSNSEKDANSNLAKWLKDLLGHDEMNDAITNLVDAWVKEGVYAPEDIQYSSLDNLGAFSEEDKKKIMDYARNLQGNARKDETAEDMTRYVKVIGTPAILPSSRTTSAYTGLQRGVVGKQDSFENLHNSATEIPPTVSTPRAPPGSSTTSSSIPESLNPIFSPSFLSRSNCASNGPSRSGSERSTGSQGSPTNKVEESSVAPSPPLSSPGSDFRTFDDVRTETRKSSVENCAIPRPIVPVRQTPRSQVDTALDSSGVLEYSKGSDWRVLERWRGQTTLEMDYSEPLREGYHVYPGKYKAKTGKKKTKVAVKLFHIASSDPNWHSQIHREVDTLVRMESHSNIAKFISEGVWKDSTFRMAYIAIKMYHRITLKDVNWSLLRDGKVRRKTQVVTYWQICSGMKHLHKIGVAHLDLKPSNVLFNTKGTNAVISDFGISKEFEIERTNSGTTMTKSTTIYGGTDGWRAAELSDYECKALEKREAAFYYTADVFSLGLIGFYIFRGQRHPFQPKNVKNKQNYKSCQRNIDFKESPDLSGTESIESHLFRQMLSHEPETRRDLKYVMGHPIFWNNCKRVGYFRDINERFQDLEKRKDTKWMDDDKLVLAFYGIPMDEESDDEESNSQQLEDDYVQFDTGEDDVEGNTKSPTKQRQEPGEKKSKKGERKTEIEETEWINLNELEKKFEKIPKETRKNIFNLYREAIPEKFIEEEKIKGKRSPKPSVRIGYNKLNSVRNLARTIRNYRTHKIDPEVEFKSNATWEYWYGRYPKYLTLLFDILPPELTPEREQYTFEENNSDLKTLLDMAASAHAHQDPTSVL